MFLITMFVPMHLYQKKCFHLNQWSRLRVDCQWMDKYFLLVAMANKKNFLLAVLLECCAYSNQTEIVIIIEI